MPLTLDELRRLYARCDPDEPLDVDDARYVDVDHISGGDDRPRRYPWVQRIARKFELASDTPKLVLLTGLPGSGKSTEVRRILAKLRDPDGAALFPVLIDAEQVIDLHAPLARPELLLTLLVETERQIMEGLEGLEPSDDAVAKDSVASRMWTYLKTTEVKLGSFNIGTHGQRLPIELKTNPSFKERVREAAGHQFGVFSRHVRQHMAELQDRVRRYEIDGPKRPRYRGVVIAFDSLEKLRGLSSNAAEVLRSVEHVFSKLSGPELGAHAIFMIPAALATRRQLNVEFMPVIKIRDKSGADYDPGLRAMHAMVSSRMSTDEQRAVFGDDYEARIRAMIVQSGGYPREVIKMLQEALADDAHPLDDRRFRVLLGARADGYRRIVRGDAIPLLRQIHAEKPPLALPNETLASTELSDMLLTNSLVMLYQNDAEWTDVNPAILPLLEPSSTDD